MKEKPQNIVVTFVGKPVRDENGKTLIAFLEKRTASAEAAEKISALLTEVPYIKPGALAWAILDMYFEMVREVIIDIPVSPEEASQYLIFD